MNQKLSSFLYHFLDCTVWASTKKRNWRYLWCNDYCRRKWTWRHKFKSWMRLFAFHILIIPLGKIWIQLLSLQLWRQRVTCEWGKKKKQKGLIRQQHTDYEPIKPKLLVPQSFWIYLGFCQHLHASYFCGDVEYS